MVSSLSLRRWSGLSNKQRIGGWNPTPAEFIVVSLEKTLHSIIAPNEADSALHGVWMGEWKPIVKHHFYDSRKQKWRYQDAE